MNKQSAGILLYRYRETVLQVFLVHPGGPFWAKKDLGAWSIPKGEFIEDEDALTAAKRELEEETGCRVNGNFIQLTPVRQKSSKMVYAWALEADFDPAILKSNAFSMEWPSRSGRRQEFPEVDRGEWFSIEDAREKLIEGQRALIENLLQLI